MYHKDKIIINIYASNNRVPKFMQQELTGRIDEPYQSEYFHNLLSIMSKTTALEINNDEQDWSDCMNDRTLGPTKAKYTLFSRPHGIFSRTDHMQNQK